MLENLFSATMKKHKQAIREALKIASDQANNPYGGEDLKHSVGGKTWGTITSTTTADDLKEAMDQQFDMEPVTAWRNRTCKPDGTEV